jgi:hypothetical protein
MNIAIKFIGYLLLGVAILATVFITLEWGMERQETYECQKWVLEAGQYQGYYLANWQVEQCKARKIDVSNIPTE